MTTPNAELAYKVLDRIDADPASWNQGWWLIRTDCGTTACFAGITCLLSGDRPDFDRPDAPLDPDKGWTYSGVVCTADGSGRDVVPRAESLLGVSTEDADRLFHAANTREHLGRLVSAIFGPRPVSAATA